MRIGELAASVGTSVHTIRFYEQRGLLPRPPRGANGYRAYAAVDAQRLRLLVGLRQLDIPLEQAAALATMCAAGQCAEVSGELSGLLAEKRIELGRRIEDLRFLDRRLAHLAGQLEAGSGPRSLITIRKEDEHAAV